MPEATNHSALLLGATGQVGSCILQELLASSHFSRVGEYGRRLTQEAKITGGSEKLEQHVIDFENINEGELRAGKWDVVFIALGTTRKAAGSAAAFEKIDREYVVNTARAAKSDDPAHVQRLVYISSGGADSSSYLLYSRSKGLTELELAALGYDETIILRPGLLTEVNREHRASLPEIMALSVAGVLSRVFTLSNMAAPISSVAKAAVTLGSKGVSDVAASIRVQKGGDVKTPYSIIENRDILALADAFKK